MSKLYWMNEVIASDNAEYINFIPGDNTGLASIRTGPAIREVALKAKGSQADISALQEKTNNMQTDLSNITSRVGTLENEFTANGTRIYMDYKNGKYGYNLSANRGADTFFPFNSLSSARAIGLSFPEGEHTTSFSASVGDWYVIFYSDSGYAFDYWSCTISGATTRLGYVNNQYRRDDAWVFTLAYLVQATSSRVYLTISGRHGFGPDEGASGSSGAVWKLTGN